jgi:hypothetical protein
MCRGWVCPSCNGLLDRHAEDLFYVTDENGFFRRLVDRAPISAYHLFWTIDAHQYLKQTHPLCPSGGVPYKDVRTARRRFPGCIAPGDYFGEIYSNGYISPWD